MSRDEVEEDPRTNEGIFTTPGSMVQVARGVDIAQGPHVWPGVVSGKFVEIVMPKGLRALEEKHPPLDPMTGIEI